MDSAAAVTPPVRLDDERREAVRAQVLAEASRFYNPWLHLACPSAIGLATLVTCVALLHAVPPLAWLTIPATFLFANAFEWTVHKNVLHTRRPLMEVLYDRHTPQHHVIYVTDDMAVRTWKEFRLVLIPAYGVAGILVVNLPIFLGLWRYVEPNVALLYLATAMTYAVSYELLHLSYHLPESHPVGRLTIIKKLKRHHAIHHNPELMQRYNMNVSIPLWDWVRGTTWKGS